MTHYETQYSDPWKGQDGRLWRTVKYWVGAGWQSFLQVKINGQWTGW